MFMMEQENKMMSAFDIFASQQETYEEALKKSSEESRKRAEYLRFTNDGKYPIRILPLAPVIDKDGNALPMERKGYEYPLRSLTLKIENPEKLDKKGNPTIQYVSVCNAKHVFKDLKEDLIEAYLRVAGDKYGSDADLIKKLNQGSFNGGLKWDNHRCMYALDMNERAKGIQIVQLSFSQYRDLEDAKMNVWNKMLKGNPTAGCPISSFKEAYPVEVTRSTENKKTKYSFFVDNYGGFDALTEDELNALLAMPRLPEALYRYGRYHLEATIVYLNQLDEQFGIKVMKENDIKEAIETIKMLIPSTDTGHFTIGGKAGSDTDPQDALDALWKRWDDIDAEGLDDKSDEGAELRADLRAFIEDNDLEIKITRGKTNQQILEEIDAAMGGEPADDDEPEDEPEVKKSSRKPAPEPEDEPEDDDEDESDNDPSDDEDEPEDDEDDDEPAEPARPSRNREERNDDTNEPAARPQRDRRTGRPQRRR